MVGSQSITLSNGKHESNAFVKASNEVEWINKVDAHSNGNIALISWQPKEVKGDMLLSL